MTATTSVVVEPSITTNSWSLIKLMTLLKLAISDATRMFVRDFSIRAWLCAVSDVICGNRSNLSALEYIH